MGARVRTLDSSRDAIDYYHKNFSRDDYYLEERAAEIHGLWHGETARRLGIEGQQVSEQTFCNLMEGTHPETGATLSVRQKSNRRAGADIVLACPKGVSTVAAYMEWKHGDSTLTDLMREAAAETIADLEQNDVCTRVRKGMFWKSEETRQTGNSVVAEFIHKTGRPVDGVPQPHYHVHMVAANVTWDAVENRFKAVDIAKSWRNHADRIHHEFDNRLAHKLKAAGFDVGPVSRVRQDGKVIDGWDIRNIDPRTIEQFSGRSNEAVDRAMALGLPTNGKTLETVGGRIKSKKTDIKDLNQLHQTWFETMLDPHQRENLQQVVDRKGGGGGSEPRTEATEHVDLAMGMLLSNHSVTTRNRVLALANQSGLGAVSVEAIRLELDRREDVLRRAHHGQVKLTTQEVYNEEQALFRLAKDRVGAYTPFMTEPPAIGPVPGQDGKSFELSSDQKRVIRNALTVASESWVSIVEGDAGTGKTEVSKIVASHIKQATGREPIALAATNEAADELKQRGFANAQTVHSFLLNTQAQADAKGRTILVDEAGLLAVRTTMTLLKTAARNEVRHVSLTGDRKQHMPVERGDALRLLQENVPSLPVSRLSEIQRQRSHPAYLKAASLAANGRFDAAIDRLETMGAVQEIANDRDRYRFVAETYLDSVRGNRTVLAVSPTHVEGAMAIREIRAALREDGRLGSQETSFIRLVPRNLSTAAKQDHRAYLEGDVIEFHARCKGGFRKGDRFEATGEADEQGRPLARAGVERRVVALPTDRAERFDLYRRRELPVAKGEKLRITKTSPLGEGRKINANTVVSVKAITRHGSIELEDGRILSRNFCHVNHGYVSTSHASQGRTVDHVIVASSSVSAPAASENEFYVSMSRGKSRITIVTDSRQGFRESVSQSAERMAATELLKQGKPVSQPAPVDHGELQKRRQAIARTLAAARDHLAERAKAIASHARQVRANLERVRTAAPRPSGPELSR